MNVDGTKDEKKTPAKTTGKPPVKHEDTIGALINQLKPQLELALPKHITVDRLARIAVTAVRNNVKLQQADRMSLMASVMQSATLGLELNTPLGHCWLIPYQNNKTGKIEAQFQMGYQGLIELSYRTGKYQVIDAVTVDAADVFEYEYGIDSHLKHEPSKTPTGEIIFYYAYWKLINGGSNFKVWSKDKVLQHAQKYSKSWDKKKKEFYYGSAWRENFDSMALVPVIKNALKLAPKSIELDIALSSDNMSFTVNPNDPELNIDTVSTDYEVE